VISNILDFKMPVREAVDSPRVHWENDVFHVEPGFYEEEVNKVRLPANNQLVRWQEKNLFFGGVHTVLETSEGVIEGAGDRRRDGEVASY
jgi:gamma-glutamyltranspeptidase/glutathione hydrolase